MQPEYLNILDQLAGRKILILGNHDAAPLQTYAAYFDEVLAMKTIGHERKRYVLTHLPLHPDSLYRWEGNIHGHLHNKVVALPGGKPDPRYINVSVEQIGYQPIALDELAKRI